MNENGVVQEDTTPAVSAEEAASRLYNKEDLAKNQEAIAKIAADYQADPRFKPVAEAENQSSPGVIPAQAEQAAEEAKDATQPPAVEAKEIEPGPPPTSVVKEAPKPEPKPAKKAAKPAPPKVAEPKKEEPKEEAPKPVEKAATAAVVPPKTTSDPAPAVIAPSKDGKVSFRTDSGLTKLSLDKDETAVRHGDAVYILKKQKGGGFEIQDEYMSNLGHSSKTDPVEALSEHLGVKAQPKSDPAPVKGTTIESKKTEEVSKAQSPKEKKEVKSSPAPIANFKVTTGKNNAILEGPGGKTVFLEPVKGNQWQSALADGTVVRNFSLPEGVNITDYAKQNGADLFSKAKK
jgi:hypothetical protein